MNIPTMEFRNTLAKLLHLDRHDLVSAGVLDDSNESGWTHFRDDPLRGALRLPDDRLKKLLELVQ